MPLYEYLCNDPDCATLTERVRPIARRRWALPCRRCAGPTSLALSVPRPACWSRDWKFPNLRKDGDGEMSFESRADYDRYLAENDIWELAGPGNPDKPLTRQKIVAGPRTRVKRRPTAW